MISQVKHVSVLFIYFDMSGDVQSAKRNRSSMRESLHGGVYISNHPFGILNTFAVRSSEILILRDHNINAFTLLWWCWKSFLSHLRAHCCILSLQPSVLIGHSNHMHSGKLSTGHAEIQVADNQRLMRLCRLVGAAGVQGGRSPGQAHHIDGACA